MLQEIISTEEKTKQRNYVERVNGWLNAKLKYFSRRSSEST